MKRILFWASGMFALGEVAYLYADRITNYSIALAMLICLAIIYVKKKKYFKRFVFLLSFIVFGFSYIMVFDMARPVSLRMNVDKNMVKDYNKSYTIYTYGKSDEDIYQINDKGIVVDASKQAETVTLRIGSGIGEYEIIVYGVTSDYKIGDYVSINGVVSVIQLETNPGTMNMRKYYGGRGIIFSAKEPDLDIHKEEIERENLSVSMYWYSLQNTLNEHRDYLVEKIYAIADEKTAGFMTSLLLGDKTYLDEEISLLFSMSGISHILVISGLHISFIGGLIYKLLNGIGVKKGIGALSTIMIILLYGNMTGAGYATLRAVIMLIISIIGERLSRDYDMLTAMSFALLLMLLRNPFSILDGGMILSFFAIGGVALGNYLKKSLFGVTKLKKMKKKKPIKYFFVSTFLMSASVNIMLTPVIANLYYGIPLYSVLLNICIVPFMGVVVGIGILGLALSYISPIWGWLVYIPIKYILKIMIILCRMVTKLPYYYINTGKVHIASVLIYYIGIFVIMVLINSKVQRRLRDRLYEKKHICYSRKKWCVIITLSIAIWMVFVDVVLVFTHKSNQEYGATFLDVGQGDGILIKTKEGLNVVIDGGSTSNASLGEYVICPALKYMNMARVDYWFISHCDEDHISGLVYVLEKGTLSGIKVENIVIGNVFLDDNNEVYIMQLAKKQGINLIIMNQGDYIVHGNTKISCLAPDDNYPYKDKNQASMGLSFESPYFNILFTGDMDKEGLEHMLTLNQGVLPARYDVIKVPHHGSRYSLCNELYVFAEGGYGVISAGKNNFYGHPHQEVLNGMIDAGVRCLVTKELGAVILEIK
ncbi:MAG: ComEC/Rec2 family competence protein [Lachnospiraceae bacterium]|nr:ComEC/Rec2 family competence protein [Lachnospiraceae bacterium]